MYELVSQDRFLLVVLQEAPKPSLYQLPRRILPHFLVIAVFFLGVYRDFIIPTKAVTLPTCKNSTHHKVIYLSIVSIIPTHHIEHANHPINRVSQDSHHEEPLITSGIRRLTIIGCCLHFAKKIGGFNCALERSI